MKEQQSKFSGCADFEVKAVERGKTRGMADGVANDISDDHAFERDRAAGVEKVNAVIDNVNRMAARLNFLSALVDGPAYKPIKPIRKMRRPCVS